MCIAAGAPGQQVRPDKDTQAQQRRILVRSVLEHRARHDAQSARGPRCKRAPPSSICNSPHLLPLERGKRSSLQTSAPARQLLPFPHEHPSRAASAPGLPEAESAPRAPGCRGSGWCSQSCRAAGISTVMVSHVGDTGGRKVNGDGPKEAERHPSPSITARHGASRHLCCERPRSMFQLPVSQRPLRLVMKKPAQVWKRPFSFRTDLVTSERGASPGSCAHARAALAKPAGETQHAQPLVRRAPSPPLPPPTFASQQKATSLAEQICLPSKQPDVSK